MNETVRHYETLTTKLDRNRHSQGGAGHELLLQPFHLPILHKCTILGPRGVVALLLLTPEWAFFMTGATEGLLMDVAEDARRQQELHQQQHQELQHQQHQEHQQQEEVEREGEDHKKELDRNESVRARLLTLSQVAPGEVLPSDTLAGISEGSSPPPQSPQSDREEEFRRKLMSISYVDVRMPAQ